VVSCLYRWGRVPKRFNGITDSKYTGSFLGSSYWFLAPAYQDLMADVVSAEAAIILQPVSVPDYVNTGQATKITNSARAKQVVSYQESSRQKAGTNMFYFEWT